MSEPVDARWQQVKCADCGKEYQCTPQTDYYFPSEFVGIRTLDNGFCWDCFMGEVGMKRRPEPSYLHLDEVDMELP